MIKKYSLGMVVGLVIFLGALVRLWQLNDSPPSLGFDEAALGYNAYSLMKTGRDEYGNSWPLSLRSFNDFKPALYAYLTIPFIKLWGLNAQAVRAVSAVAGVISLWFLWLLLKRFIPNKYLLIGIFCVLSFEPWRLHFSRNALETHLSAMFFVMGVWGLVEAKSKIRLAVSMVLLALAAYSYHSARLAAPLLITFWALDPIVWFEKKRFGVEVKKLWTLGLFLVLCVPIFVANNSSLLLTRFRQENVFARFYPYAPREMLGVAGSSLYYLGGIISGHVWSYFSPVNLSQRIYPWVKGSPQFIPGMGLLGWIEGVMFIVGLGYLLKSLGKSAETRTLVYWIVAGAAPAAATWTWFHPLRSMNIYPAIEIIVAMGVWQTWEYLNQNIKINWLKTTVVGGIIGLMLITVNFTINNELLYSAYENHGEYQPGGFKEGMGYFKSLQDNYDQVIIDSPHAQSFIFFLFYEGFDPQTLQKYADIRPKPGVEGNLNFNFDKFVFRKIDWPKDRELRKTLFWAPASVTTQEVEIVPGARVRKIVSNAIQNTAVIITTE